MHKNKFALEQSSLSYLTKLWFSRYLLAAAFSVFRSKTLPRLFFTKLFRSHSLRMRLAVNRVMLADAASSSLLTVISTPPGTASPSPVARLTNTYACRCRALCELSDIRVATRKFKQLDAMVRALSFSRGCFAPKPRMFSRSHTSIWLSLIASVLATYVEGLGTSVMPPNTSPGRYQ